MKSSIATCEMRCNNGVNQSLNQSKDAHIILHITDEKMQTNYLLSPNRFQHYSKPRKPEMHWSLV